MPRRRQKNREFSIPQRANRVLVCLLVALAVIAARIWQLSVLEHDDRVEATAGLQLRHEQVAPERATIRDRFNIPLAVNRVQYQAAILYSGIREVPSIQWEEAEDGTRIKRFRRREYIRELAEMLAAELGRDAERIEDEIHAKAALYGSRPFVLAEEIDEATYYKLKAKERDWPGLVASQTSRRWYPEGPVACGILGYMGAINREEYEKGLAQLRSLQRYMRAWELGEQPPLPEGMHNVGEVRDALARLRKQSYGIHDYVGKSGVEAQYETVLRGLRGVKGYTANARGNLLHTLPGAEEPVPGDRLLLTISSELQEYCEQLLAKNERLRDGRSQDRSAPYGQRRSLREPWIKGGAIVAMDPKTGEILSLASFPRYDPNDFIRSGDPQQQKVKQQRIMQWFETEEYVAQIWEGKRPMTRESYTDRDGWGEEELWIDWHAYLDQILPEGNPVRERLWNMTIGNAAEIGSLADEVPGRLRWSLEEEEPSIEAERLSGRVGSDLHPRDVELLVDLCQMVVDTDRFGWTLLAEVGDRSLSEYREDTRAFHRIEEVVKGLAATLFHELDFREWRDEFGPDYIKLKREEEQARRTYTRPYLDYYDLEERRQWKQFWSAHRHPLMLAFLRGETQAEPALVPYLETLQQWWLELRAGAHARVEWRVAYDRVQQATQDLSSEQMIAYSHTMRCFDELTTELRGWYPQLRKQKGRQLQKHLAAAFYPQYGFGYARSHAFRQLTPQGSSFKLVVAYEALRQRQLRIDQGEPLPLNPFEMYDRYQRGSEKSGVGTFLDGTVIPRRYKGGRVPRTLNSNVGRIDLVKALEHSSNPYFALLCADHMEDPEDLNRVAAALSFGSKTGIDLPGELPGRLPDDLDSNPTGLYSMSMGQHKLDVTPLQTATAMAAMVNGGKVLKPRVTKLTVGSQGSEQCLAALDDEFDYGDALHSVGIDFPLFTATARTRQQQRVTEAPTEVVRELYMTPGIEDLLKRGMEGSLNHSLQGSVLYQVYRDEPGAIAALKGLRGQLVGKSCTAERMEWIDLDRENGANMYNHIWFPSVCYDESGEPELVVAVYLRFGGYGKEAAPLAAQVAKKWREIRDRG